MGVITKEKCPSCAKMGRDRSGDNLVRYDDGGAHCFSCGYHEHGNSARKAFKGATSLPEEPTLTHPLPYDVDPAIPAMCLEWLRSFHITMQDVIDNQILWSESKQMLVFPYDNCWQGRYFGDMPHHPKWYTRGDIKNIIHGKGLTNADKGVILVEDIVSCIRVGKYLPCVCLFGSHLSTTQLDRLLHVSDKFYFWLDYDKRTDASKQGLKLLGRGIQSSLIISELDPKCYSNEELKIMLDKIYFP